jgi:hypothetical protein
MSMTGIFNPGAHEVNDARTSTPTADVRFGEARHAGMGGKRGAPGAVPSPDARSAQGAA